MSEREALESLLTPREETVIRARFGIDRSKETLQKCAQKLGVTRERIRQIEFKSMRKLRVAYSNLENDKLKDTILSDAQRIFAQFWGRRDQSGQKLWRESLYFLTTIRPV